MDCPISNATQIQIVFTHAPCSVCKSGVQHFILYSYNMICYIKVLCANTHTHTHRCCCCYCNFFPSSIRHLIYLEFFKTSFIVYSYTWTIFQFSCVFRVHFFFLFLCCVLFRFHINLEQSDFQFIKKCRLNFRFTHISDTQRENFLIGHSSV